jgi:hypothetical protein
VVALACSTALLISDPNRDHLLAKPLTADRPAMGLQHRSLGVGWLLLLVSILQTEESICLRAQSFNGVWRECGDLFNLLFVRRIFRAVHNTSDSSKAQRKALRGLQKPWKSYITRFESHRRVMEIREIYLVAAFLGGQRQVVTRTVRACDGQWSGRSRFIFLSVVRDPLSGSIAIWAWNRRI